MPAPQTTPTALGTWPSSIEDTPMREGCCPNQSTASPCVGKPYGQVTMNPGDDVIAHLKGQTAKTGIPYQWLVSLYLSQCVEEDKTLAFM